MFDHGADSINAATIALASASIMQEGCSRYMPILTMCITFGFFLATLEHYYCGKLELGMFNGVSDACLFVYYVGLTSAFFGCEVWQQKRSFGISMYEMIFYGAIIMSLITGFFKYFF